jgi:D-cysteine desulfhydrase
VNRLVALPRSPLATLPTPLHPAPRLSEAIGVEVWFKRDDLTGFGLGGNKVRGLEYLMGDALAAGCDCLVTGAGPQSNWAMLAALAARRSGLDPHLVFYGSPVPPAGNLLLDEVIGAEVHYTGDPDRTSVDAGIEALAEKLRAAGHRPYVLPRGGATVLGSAGYLRASVELAGQLADAGLIPTQLWLATGSCGTQAGLVAGARWLRAPYRVTGVSVSRPVAECTDRVSALAEGAAELLGLPRAGPTGTTDVIVLGGHIGPGYGTPSADGSAAAELVARTEGVFLDPVFAAKAMAALIETVPIGPVVFLVSGGAPTLFAARKEPM